MQSKITEVKFQKKSNGSEPEHEVKPTTTGTGDLVQMSERSGAAETPTNKTL